MLESTDVFAPAKSQVQKKQPISIFHEASSMPTSTCIPSMKSQIGEMMDAFDKEAQGGPMPVRWDSGSEAPIAAAIQDGLEFFSGAPNAPSAAELQKIHVL